MGMTCEDCELRKPIHTIHIIIRKTAATMKSLFTEKTNFQGRCYEL